MDPTQQIVVREVGDVTVVSFACTKILDEQVIQAVGDRLYQLIDYFCRRKILISFVKVEHFSSAAIGKLITAQKKLNHLQGCFALSDVDPKIFEAFERIGMKEVFRIHTDEQSALQDM